MFLEAWKENVTSAWGGVESPKNKTLENRLRHVDLIPLFVEQVRNA